MVSSTGWCAALALLTSANIAGHTQAPIAVMQVNVVDVRNGRIQADVTLLIARRQIMDILSGKQAPPADASVFDGRGKFAIPGLWDMHYHFDRSEPGIREYNLLVANGVLGIRDMGDKIFPARDEIASGRVLGPRIIACGPIIDGPQPTTRPSLFP
jgi:imidazolonepropionase-like amidohydrolase